MSTYGSLFNPYATQSQIDELQQQILDSPEYGSQVLGLRRRLDQAELFNKALVELLVTKGIASASELRVLMQQIDLADGVEDGRVSESVRRASPRCGQCQRFLNPKRESCVYCGTAMAEADPDAEPPREVIVVNCSACGTSVDESESYFSTSGLVCPACFDPNA